MSTGKYDQTTKEGLAKMLKGGVIMDVSNVEQAQIAEKAGAVAVMALEKIPSEMRKSGKVCRMSDPHMIKKIKEAVSIPVMAKVRIGHEGEAQILECLGIDYIDESEVLTTANPLNHIEKKNYKLPFVCGAKNLGEALRRIQEGAVMIRSKGEAGTGDVSQAVYHVITIEKEIESIKSDPVQWAKENRVDPKLAEETAKLGRLPVVMFAAGGIATPADAALMMQKGCDGIFVGSGIFNSEHPERLAAAIVSATTHFNDPAKLLEVSTDLGEMMPGVSIAEENKKK